MCPPASWWVICEDANRCASRQGEAQVQQTSVLIESASDQQLQHPHKASVDICRCLDAPRTLKARGPRAFSQISSIEARRAR
jgi:hypothetical protein